MRVVSWNVNGMRAALGKGFLEWFKAAKPDVLSLQEVRCEYDELEPAARKLFEKDYDVCWFPASSKKGYAGSATLSRKGLGFAHTKGMGLDAYDREGRIVVSKHPGFTLVAGYFPNASAELVRLDYKRAFSRALVKYIEKAHKKGEKLVIVGDVNCAPEEIDIARPKTNRKSPGFTDEEREDFRGYLKAGVVDVLRERNPTTPGLYTWWAARGGARERNVGWRLDIFLVSKGLVEKVRDVKIHADVMGSDHCPVSLDVDV